MSIYKTGEREGKRKKEESARNEEEVGRICRREENHTV